ncbi:uncharacterized protein LOC129730552 [Wyeomyia smithii]|uniref:uncharacterized protein LOC129730552 n=1 Tax=Wyeomyia smithii TaxID=174621 RepID=UPI0024682058|nr:uncharacterized protein LOC129730552 [Wyeomyia smithii]
MMASSISGITRQPPLLLLLLIVIKQSSGCFFPIEYQGEYITQNTVTDGAVRYSRINITESAIPIWGMCHKRHDNNVVLVTGTEEAFCFRCFNLKLVSKNVLRVLTADSDYISKCHTNEEKALASCLGEDALQDEEKSTEIILYKFRDWNGDEVRQEYCPIHGRYKLTYNIDNGTEDQVECESQESEVDNCPSGSALNLRFRNCAFRDQEVTFECLGHWRGLRNQNYVALVNANGDARLGPKYRCATWVENPKSGEIEISFSKDSTCRSINKYHRNQNSYGNNIHSEYHSEVVSLKPIPQEFGQISQYCSFPNWLIGKWEQVIVSQNQLIYKDHTSFKTYTMKCVKNHTNHEADKYIVYSQTQCGEEKYQCLKIQRRDENVFEFQISSRSEPNYTSTICNEFYFNDDRWLTQGRLDSNSIVSPCPIVGEFSGVIPDDEGLCAKLSSECGSPDIMYYQISACEFDEIYEEREYRCLGQWTHRNIVYTYTQRRDVGTYECFVGTMLSDRQIFIKEAGEHCQRDVNPHRFGMELNKVAHCSVPETFKPSSRPTHKYSELSTIRASTSSGHSNNYNNNNSNQQQQHSSSPSVVANTTPSSPVVTTGRSNTQYTVTNQQQPKQQQPQPRPTARPSVPGSAAAGTRFVQSQQSSYLLLLATLICVILGCNKFRC